MERRMFRSSGHEPTIPIRLTILLGTVLAIVLGTLPSLTPIANGEELDMDVVNEQALQTLALSGQKVKQVELGAFHSAAITLDGSLFIWGNNDHYELGDGTTTDSKTPKRVGTLSNVVDVALGYWHSGAVTADGSLYTWGHNSQGQLGNGTTENQPRPKKVEGISNVVDLVFGTEDHSAAITSDGSLYTWGDDFFGALGDRGDGAKSTIPQRVVGLSNVVDVSLGRWHTAALTGDGRVYTWGGNYHGQLGNGTFEESEERYDMVEVPGLPRIVDVCVGDQWSAALGADGSVYTWGRGDCGELGDGTTIERRATPQKVPGLPSIAAITAGLTHGAALTSDGSLYMWGDGDYGRLGDGTSTRRPSPQKLQGIPSVASVSLGHGHSGAVTTDGSLYMWGRDYEGQIGDGTTDDKRVPTMNTFFYRGGSAPSQTAALSINPSSITFKWDIDTRSYDPQFQLVTLTHENCVPGSVTANGNVRVELVDAASARTTKVYRVTPTGAPPASNSASVTFSGQSTVGGANPSPANLSVNYESAKPTYFEDIVRQTQATQYNPNLAYELAQLSRMAYDDNVVGEHCSIENKYEEWGFTVDENDYADDYTAAYTLGSKTLADGSKMVLITIRGSKGYSWASDFNLSVTEYSHGWHNGFSNSANAVYTGIETYLNGVDTKNTRYVITGHSLGAATGNLLAMKLSEAGVPNEKVYDYNFACPDVAWGNRSYWDENSNHDNIFNIGNQYDFVSFTPRSLGPLSLFTNMNPFKKWGKFGQTRWFSPTRKQLWNPVDVIIDNHSMDLYCKYFELKEPFDELLTESQLSSTEGMAYFSMGFHCPVDVEVYDNAGNVVVSVKDGKVEYGDSANGNVIALADGDEKFVFIPTNKNYRVKVTATDEGEMRYQIVEGILGSDEAQDEKNFESVGLDVGKTLVTGTDKGSSTGDVKFYVADPESGVPTKEVTEDGTEVPATDISVDMYRMYNPWTGEHLYTADATERDTMRADGWDYEGVMWSAPWTSFSPVWRLYNPWTGDHHYARTRNEYDTLQGQGWSGEGIAFYSAGTDGVPVHRLFNPYQTGVGTHNYTVSSAERDANVTQGWKYEEVGWYGLR